VVLLVIAVMIGVTAVAGIVSLFDDGSEGESTEPVATEPSTTPSPTAPEPKPEWDAGVLSTKVVNPATVRVTFLVMNKGDAPGRPVCTTRVRDFRSNDTWFEINTAKEPIKPGKIARFNVLVTVTNEGARYATYERVKCETA
jgi:hypothetical protein